VQGTPALLHAFSLGVAAVSSGATRECTLLHISTSTREKAYESSMEWRPWTEGCKGLSEGHFSEEQGRSNPDQRAQALL
jgi:hypothetical protein